MERREFLIRAAALGAAAMVPGGPLMDGFAKTTGPGSPLTPPAQGPIRVAVAITDGATVIDFAGPWEVFQDVDAKEGFELFTVGDSTQPVRGSAGLQLVPDYAFDKAPQPHVIVVGAQRGSDALRTWLKSASEKTDLTM